MIKEMTRFVIKKVNGKRELVQTPRLLKPFEYEDVIAIRDDEVGLDRATNIRWVTDDWHVNAAFEWGYQGTGPGYLAKNILMHFTDHDEEFSEKHFLGFKERFVATLPRPGGRIKKEEIFKFINEKRAEK